MKNLDIDRERLAAFCRRHHIRTMAFFGSVLREDFQPNSDVDVLVEFRPEVSPTLFDLVRMQEELKDILGREVDLIEKRGIEQSRNYLRRRAILSTMETVYAEG
mgnify:CR=1 FL=1|jgi:predicted nucleotidyltransferase